MEVHFQMERYAWKGKIREGRLEDYKKWHGELFWPEMKDALLRSGVHNYSIWNVHDEVFGYMECEVSAQQTFQIQAEDEVVKRWGQLMSDILIRDIDPATGKPYPLMQVFMLE